MTSGLVEKVRPAVGELEEPMRPTGLGNDEGIVVSEWAMRMPGY